MPNRAYHLVAQITDPSENAASTASAGSLTVAPPQIELTGTFTRTPVPGNAGKSSLSFTVSNTGNTPAAGTLAFNIDRNTTSSLAGATVVTTASKKIDITHGKSTKITDVTTLPAGSYFLLVDLDPDNVFQETSPADNIFATGSAITTS